MCSIPDHDGADPSSPLHITIAGKIQREIGELYMPLSQYKLSKSLNTEDGRKEEGEISMEAATTLFANLTEETARRMKLASGWVLDEPVFDAVEPVALIDHPPLQHVDLAGAELGRRLESSERPLSPHRELRKSA